MAAAAEKRIGLSVAFTSKTAFQASSISLVTKAVKAIQVNIPQNERIGEVQELKFACYRWKLEQPPLMYRELDLTVQEIANLTLKVGSIEIPCVKPKISQMDQRYKLLITSTNYSLKAEIVESDILDRAALKKELKELLTPPVRVTISQFLDLARSMIEETSSGLFATLFRLLFDPEQETRPCDPEEMLNQFIEKQITKMSPDVRNEFLVAIRTMQELKESLVEGKDTQRNLQKILNRMCLRKIGIEEFETQLRSILKALAGEHQDSGGMPQLIERAVLQFIEENFTTFITNDVTNQTI